MVASTALTKIKMLPYKRQGEIDYSSLDFDPFEAPEKPDGMRQRPSMFEVVYTFRFHFGVFHNCPNVFLDTDTYICYDPENLSSHISPDVCLAFGVDVKAIMERELYLPWEVGKAPDWVLEVGAKSTGQVDVGDKVTRYEQMGVQEYWRFDPSGGAHHGVPLGGDILVDGKYQPVELTSDPDGILKAYSPVLDLYLCWVEQPNGQGLPAFYDRGTNAYIANAAEVVSARREAGARADAAEAQREQDRRRRIAAEAEIRQLRDELKRLQSD